MTQHTAPDTTDDAEGAAPTVAVPEDVQTVGPRAGRASA